MGTVLSTLCYIEKDGQYLMLHRIRKKNDINKDKWIGVGGHFEEEESPEDCVLREVREETGYTLTSYQFRGLVTFVSGDGVIEYMSLFTADGFEGTPIACDEGQLEWIDKEEVWNLNLWEGDRIFFRLLEERKSFFSLKLVYDGKGGLLRAVLDGKNMELFDVLDEEGEKTGRVAERGVVHRIGIWHQTSHIWIVREQKDHVRSGFDLLLQKRSSIKDSNPGKYDISSAGHIEAGDEPLDAAIRELKEELGIRAEASELHYIGKMKRDKEDVFYQKPFIDRQWSSVFLYEEPIETENLVLQESEVESVKWMDFGECMKDLEVHPQNYCISSRELIMIDQYRKMNKR